MNEAITRITVKNVAIRLIAIYLFLHNTTVTIIIPRYTTPILGVLGENFIHSGYDQFFLPVSLIDMPEKLIYSPNYLVRFGKKSAS